MDEEFKKIDDFDNYSVSNLSRVRNDETGRILKAGKDGGGYLFVYLSKKNKKPKMFKIHRLVGIYFIENINDYKEIDHINRNSLDNRIENLRWVSRSQNKANRGKFKNATSIYIGVSFDKDRNKWRSCIKEKDKKRKYFGYFNTELEAFVARQNYILNNNLAEFYN
jgi:hypothetical protein